MKKKLTSILLICTLLTSFVACGTQEDIETSTSDEDTTTSETVESNRLTELGNKDFNKRTFTIMDANDYPSTNIIYPEDAPNGDIINDALYNRNAKIEDLYNINIEYVHMDPAKTGAEAVRQSVLSDDSEYDLVNSTVLGGTLNTLATQGILANLADVPYISLDKNWWSSLMSEKLKLDGKIYFTAGDITYRIYLSPFCTYINSGLMNDYDIDLDIYDLVLNGKWTMDVLYGMTKQYDNDIDGDGIMHTDTDFFGLVMQKNVLTTNALTVACGIDLAEINDNTLEVNLDSEKVLNVVEKLKKLTTEKYQYTNQNDIYLKAFSENRAIVCFHVVSTANTETLRNMNNDFLIVPIPKSDEEQETYRSLVNAWGNSFVAIPTNADSEFSGFITEAMAYESYASVRPKFYETVLKEKLTRDERAKKMIDIITETAYLDFNVVYDFGSSTTSLYNAIWLDSPLASALASSKQVIESSVDEFVKNWTQSE